MEQEIFPVTRSQEEGLLSRAVADMRGQVYPTGVIALALQFNGKLDTAALKYALNTVVNRHSALRTVFAPAAELTAERRLQAVTRYGRTAMFDPGVYGQAIINDVPVPLQSLDLADLTPSLRERTLFGVAEREFNSAFRLDSIPRIRPLLVRVSEGEHLLIVFLDHLVGDLWSKQVIRRDLLSFYSSAVCGRPPVFDGTSFAKYARWQHDEITQGHFDHMAQFWREQWAAYGQYRLTFSDLPFARTTPTQSPLEMEAAIDVIDEELSSRVRQFLKRVRLTPHTFFTSAFSILLHCLTGRQVFGIWMHMANRSHPSTKETVGWFTHTHMLGLEALANVTAEQLCVETRSRVARACAMEGFPLAALWHTLQCHPLAGDARVLIDSYEEASHESVLLADGVSVIEREPPGPAGPRFSSLGIYVSASRGEIRLTSSTSLARFPSGLGPRLLRELKFVVAQMVEHPSKALTEFRTREMPRAPVREPKVCPEEMREYLLSGDVQLPKLTRIEA